MQYCLNWGPNIHLQFGTNLACEHLFKYPNLPSTLPTSSKTITRVKMSNVKTSKGALWEGFTFPTCLLDSMHTKLNDWCKYWSKPSQLTNQRAHHARSWYTEMRYWKQCLQAPLVLSLPSPCTDLVQLFSKRFPHYLGTWNRLFVLLLPHVNSWCNIFIINFALANRLE